MRPKEGRTGRRVPSRGVTTAVGAPGHWQRGEVLRPGSSPHTGAQLSCALSRARGFQHC